jgi:DNA-binding ferritin-like protein
MERLSEITCYYISFLRALALIHQSHHWLTRGKNFYGNHLLLDRIYKSAAENSDLAAEKLIGIFGDDSLELPLHAEYMHKLLEKFSSGEPISTSLLAEKKFLELSQKFYDALKKADKMTLGLDDMIMAIASQREEAVYLLGQVEKTASNKDLKTAARKLFLNRIIKKQ